MSPISVISGPWIGVDLDGTLAYDNREKFPEIGEPIPQMLQRVKDWIAEGRDVRIFTARVGKATEVQIRYASGDLYSTQEEWDQFQTEMIQAWCLKYLDQALPVTCAKDFQMVELWDDRAVQVIPNEGRSVHEYYRGILMPGSIGVL